MGWTVLRDRWGSTARRQRFDDDLATSREEVVGSGQPFSIVRWSARA